MVFEGATDERTVEPASETDVGGPVPAAEPAVGRGPVAGPRFPTRTVAPLVLAAGIQLRGLPEAAGHRERVSGERDRTVVGQADRGHGQGAQCVLRQAGVRAVLGQLVEHVPGHGVHVRAEQRCDQRGVPRQRRRCWCR